MLKKFLKFALIVTPLVGCGEDVPGAVAFSETSPTDIHRQYTVNYDESTDETTYTAEFSKRSDGSKVYMPNTRSLKASDTSLVSVYGAKSGVYTAKSAAGYREDEIEFRWTNHTSTIVPDFFPAPQELSPVESSIRFRRGQNLVIRLFGYPQDMVEEELVGVLENGGEFYLLASSVTNRQAVFKWENIRDHLNNNNWYFYVVRERDIKQAENKALGQYGTANYKSIYRSRAVPVSRAL